MFLHDALLAFGLIFATFTQLRATGSPVGLGEVCLVMWLLVAAERCAGRLGVPLPAAFLRLLAFWLIIAAALCIGTMTAYLVGEVNPRSLFLHDVIAYILVALASLFLLLQPQAAARLRSTAWCLVVLGSASLALLLGEASGLISISGVDVWYYERLAGWSSNANQLSLLSLILALLSLHLAETARLASTRLVALACAVLPVTVGFLTLSDAFVAGLAFAGLGFVAITAYRALASARRSGLGSVLAIFAVLATPALIASSAPLLYVIGAKAVKQHAHDPAPERLERDMGYRTELWDQAIRKGVVNGMLGLGPGPHLVRPADLREPQWDALPNFEAHNTLMDMFLQGGLLAVATLLWLIISTTRRVLRAKLIFLPLLLISMGLFAQSHFIIRHPIIWFVIAFGLALGDPTRAKRAAIMKRGPVMSVASKRYAPAWARG